MIDISNPRLEDFARAGGLRPVLSIPTPWEIVEDDKGYLNIHHPYEDDGDTQGDLVATCFQDERHALLIAAAPDLLGVLLDMFENPKFQVAIGGNPIMVDDLMARARAAIAKATQA